MHRVVVLALLIILPIGTFSCIYGNFAKNIKIQSSTSSSNIIDHLPFIINETDVYYIAKDLSVNGTGITILADNVVLLGQRHTIIGDGTGIGVNVSSQDVTIMDCKIKNFQAGILTEETGKSEIAYNIVSDNQWGIVPLGNYNLIFSNIIIGSYLGLMTDTGWYNNIFNNYFKNGINAYTPSDETNYWNDTKNGMPNIINGPNKGGNYWNDYTGQDSDGDGLGDTPYPIFGGQNRDYLPLVDLIPPEYSNPTVFRSFPPNTYSLSVTWKDNVQVDKSILESDGVNHTDVQKINENLGFNEYYQVEHSVTCNKLFTLPLGTHYYRWYANDTRDHWNSTELLSFNVIGIPEINSIDISPILKVTANITCEGVNNITEVMDYVNLNFKIDDNWFTMPMDYNPTTELYSAMIPVYNQLANKTLVFYVVAKDKYGNFKSSEMVVIYNVPVWVKTDANRDGKIDIKDLVLVIKYFGEHP